MMSNRVVITGVGTVSPFGIGNGPFIKGLQEGRSCLKEITGFDVSSTRSKKGGLVPGFTPETFDDSFRFCRLPRVFQYALVSSELAIEDANLPILDEPKEEIGVFFGTDQGAVEQRGLFLSDMIEKGPSFVKPLLFQNTTFSAGSGLISIKYGILGPNIVIPGGYCSGNLAIYMASLYLKYGKLQTAIVVCADEVTRVGFEALYSLKVLSPQGSPEEMCRPFDAGRNGIIVGEGACAFVLETLDHAAKRNPGIYGEITGIGNSHDAFRLAGNDPLGSGIEGSMREAINEAEINHKEIDYIASTANSSVIWDKAETLALKRVFDHHAYNVSISSIKSMIGETHAAGAGFNVAACLFSFTNGFIPPTINLENPDPECDLDYVANVSKKADVNIALANAYSFGGNSVSIILKNYKEIEND